MLPPVEPVLPGAAAIAELMPMTWALSSTSGPPELPGLMAASVWIAPISRPPEELPDSVRHLDVAVERADDARGHGAGQAEGRAERDHRIADDQAGGLPEGGRRKVGPVDPHDREVGLGVTADDPRPGPSACPCRSRR